MESRQGPGKTVPAVEPPDPASGRIMVEVSAGELIDKIGILHIKSRQIKDSAKLLNVRTELEALESVRQRALPNSPELNALSAELEKTNAELFEVIDGIYRCEADGDLGRKFIDLARAVYRLNDRRAVLKRRINRLVGSRIVEEKAHDLSEGPEPPT